MIRGMSVGTKKRRRRGATLPFTLPDVGEGEIAAVVEALRSGWLTTGPRTKEFERQFAARIGVEHAVAVNSGTAALHLALEAAGVGRGDQVIVPTYTFTASAEVVTYLGAEPVLVDVRSSDLNIDPERVEAAITEKTRAVIGVDLAGIPCDWQTLRDIADRHGLILVDDAAHALPSSLNGRLIGTWADLTAFSFYATKPLTTAEGGMLVTNGQQWAQRAAMMSLHGISHDAWRRYEGLGRWFYEVGEAGFKYNLTDVAAAMGLVQLARLDEMTGRRAEIAGRYVQAFSRHPELHVTDVTSDRETSWHLFILRLDLERLSGSRADFIDSLAARKIATSVHFIPLHLHPYWSRALAHQQLSLPVAEREYERALSIPIYSRMSDQDVEDVISAVESTIEERRR
jgi:dTDP-4-amino-4,6-dideoxygalactose transaminase